LPAHYGALAILSLKYNVRLAPYSACKESKTEANAEMNCNEIEG